jgi:formylglycine-generating enzyme required for sulfatase activity
MHLRLQEYLCAESLSAAKPDWIDEILPELEDEQGLEWWREVILLLAGLPDPAPFATLVPELLKQPAKHRALLRDCLVETPDLDLSPFLAALTPDQDDGHDAGTQALVLELLVGRNDPELLELTTTLSTSPDPRVAELAQGLLERHAPTPVTAREGFDLLLVHAPADRDLARDLAGDLRARGLKPWLAREQLSEGTAWQETGVLQGLLKQVHQVLVLAAAARPWEDPETRDALDLFSTRGLSLWAIGNKAGAPKDLLPPSNWLPGRGKKALDALAAQITGKERTTVSARIVGLSILQDDASPPSTTTVTTPQPGETYTEPHTGARLLWIPVGGFAMGSKEISTNEQPVHRIRLSPFRLAETPVSNRQYALFLETGDHREPQYWRDRRFSDPEQPVVGVSWEDATAYCDWLTRLSGLPVTLPSEAQWEYAARGDDRRRYPWGGQRPDQELACFKQNREKGRPDPVGSHPKGRGPFGALDQAGNVREWCLDTWDDKAYDNRKTAEPLDPVVTSGDTARRVLRGGSWHSPARSLQAAYRDRLLAWYRLGVVGFRVAIAPASL